jgi:general secretion pathway protein I
LGPRRRYAEGFTLLEVMVALAIVGGLLVTLLYTVAHHLDAAERHETVTKAVLLARQKLAEAQQTAEPDEGAFEEPDQGYEWKVEIKETPFPEVNELAVIVTKDKERVVLRELLRKREFK